MILKITDGTTTIDLVWHSSSNPNYMLSRDDWTPGVARLKNGMLSGDGPYDPVVEEIGIRVMGTTAAAALSRLATLTALIDAAERWQRNAPVSAVKIKYSPTGSTVSSVTPLEAVILGRPEGDTANPVGLAPTFNSQLNAFVVDVRLRFVRRGVWSAASESASSAAAANPSVLAVTMPSAPAIPGPVSLSITGFAAAAVTGAIHIPPAYIMFGPQINLQQAEAPFLQKLPGTVTYTSTADAAARASGGNVGRFDFSAAPVNNEAIIYFVPSFSGSRQMAVYCTYRNNTASAWTIRLGGGAGVLSAASLVETFAPTVRLDGAATNPTVLYLGTLASQYGIDYVGLHIAITTKVGACTLDFDTIVFVDQSNGEAFVLTLSGGVEVLGGALAGQAVDAVIANDQSQLTPDVRLRLSGGQTIPQSYSGPAALVAKGSALKAVWYGTHLYNGVTPYWTTQDVGGSAAASLTAVIVRYPGYLAPS